MKTLKYFSLLVLAVALLAIPAAAQKGKDRSNAGGAKRGDDRAEQVQSTNKKPDNGKDPDKDKDADKDKKKGWHKGQGKHKSHHH